LRRELFSARRLTLQYTYDRFIAGDRGLSQRALAKKVGTTASVICRLEDADYEGHCLSMLRRIAPALGKRVEIRFVPAAGPKRAKHRKVA
jgi:transcriptional regulator with XRE-family HTH domain